MVASLNKVFHSISYMKNENTDALLPITSYTNIIQVLDHKKNERERVRKVLDHKKNERERVRNNRSKVSDCAHYLYIYRIIQNHICKIFYKQDDDEDYLPEDSP